LESLITDDNLHSGHLGLLVELDDCQHPEKFARASQTYIIAGVLDDDLIVLLRHGGRYTMTVGCLLSSSSLLMEDTLGAGPG